MACYKCTVLARRSMLPKQAGSRRAGPFTLGSLYEKASGGASLVGAHDALADAAALCTVWQWLVEEVGIEGSSDFQTYLQQLGYSAPEPLPQQRRRGAPSICAPRTVVKVQRTATACVTPDRGGSVTRISGIGPKLASQLDRKGIGTCAELEAVWVARGRDHKRMLGWLIKSLPGSNSLVLAKAVKGIKAEFDQS